MIGNSFIFLWSEGCKAENCMGVIVTNCLSGKVVKVERYNGKGDDGQYCYWGWSLGHSILLLSSGW